MATRTFESLVTRLAPSVPGCPSPVIETEVRNSAVSACERTLAWRYIQPQIRLTPGVYDYPYEVPTGSEVQAFLSVALNGQPLQVLPIEELSLRYPEWSTYIASERGAPLYVSQIDVDNFIVAPAPDTARPYDITMVLALKPLRDAEGMDKTAFDDLEDAIMFGALRALLVMPQRHWSDLKLAAYYDEALRKEMIMKRAQANLGAGRISLSVAPRAFV